MSYVRITSWKASSVWEWAAISIFLCHEKFNFDASCISPILKTFIGCQTMKCLTHWGRVTHICVSKLSIIGSDNGLSPDRRQAIIWTSAGILLIGTLGTKFNEILIEIQIFSFKNIHLKMSSGKWRPFCLGLNVLISTVTHNITSLLLHGYIKYCPWSWLACE